MQKRKIKGYLIALAVLLFVTAPFWMPSVHRWVANEYADEAWDRKVKALCKKDGGLRIFNVAHINQSLFKQMLGRDGEITIPPKEFSSTTPFFTETEKSLLYQQRYKKGGEFGGIQRVETKYIQREGWRVLAVNVQYVMSEIRKGGGRSVFFGRCELPERVSAKRFIHVVAKDAKTNWSSNHK